MLAKRAGMDPEVTASISLVEDLPELDLDELVVGEVSQEWCALTEPGKSEDEVTRPVQALPMRSPLPPIPLLPALRLPPPPALPTFEEPPTLEQVSARPALRAPFAVQPFTPRSPTRAPFASPVPFASPAPFASREPAATRAPARSTPAIVDSRPPAAPRPLAVPRALAASLSRAAATLRPAPRVRTLEPLSMPPQMEWTQLVPTVTGRRRRERRAVVETVAAGLSLVGLAVAGAALGLTFRDWSPAPRDVPVAAAIAAPLPAPTAAPVQAPDKNLPEPVLSPEALPLETAAAPEPAPREAAPTHATTLSLTSTPSCSVVVDGRPLGNTPLVVRVSPGSHSVLFVNPEGGRVARRVDVAAGRTESVSARFEE